MSTTNLGLATISPSTLACDGLIEAFNANMALIDGMPVPIASGSNARLSYQKYSDGTLHVFGCIDVGTSYPCDTTIARDFQCSKSLSVTYPVAFASTGYSLSLSVSATAYADVSFACGEKTREGFSGSFVLPISDSGVSNSKALAVDAWGRWR